MGKTLPYLFMLFRRAFSIFFDGGILFLTVASWMIFPRYSTGSPAGFVYSIIVLGWNPRANFKMI